VNVGYFVSDAFTVARRNLIKIKRVPDLLVFTTLQPIMFVLLFGFVFGSAIGGIAGHGWRSKSKKMTCFPEGKQVIFIS